MFSALANYCCSFIYALRHAPAFISILKITWGSEAFCLYGYPSKDNFFPFLFLPEQGDTKDLAATYNTSAATYNTSSFPFQYSFCLDFAKLLLFLVTRAFLFRETLLEASPRLTQTASCKFKFQWNSENDSFWVLLLICWCPSLLLSIAFSKYNPLRIVLFSLYVPPWFWVPSLDHFSKFVIFQGTTRSGWPRSHLFLPLGPLTQGSHKPFSIPWP